MGDAVHNLFNFRFFQQIPGKMFANRNLIPAQRSAVFKNPLTKQHFQMTSVNIIFIDAGKNLAVGRVIFQIGSNLADGMAGKQIFVILPRQPPSIHGVSLCKDYVGGKS